MNRMSNKDVALEAPETLQGAAALHRKADAT
jgi:hypothetical protein